jgi:hypothetical protein
LKKRGYDKNRQEPFINPFPFIKIRQKSKNNKLLFFYAKYVTKQWVEAFIERRNRTVGSTARLVTSLAPHLFPFHPHSSRPVPCRGQSLQPEV